MNPVKTILTKEQFNNENECKCGKQLFKYHNVSKNMFISKCTNTPEEYDIKLKKWIKSKKLPCDVYNIYNAERPIFKEIENKKIIEPEVKDFDKELENNLRSLFKFLHVSNRSSTLDEINILVKYKLKKEPLKTYYSPTTTTFMKKCGTETFQDYQDRIFSEPIIDLDYKAYKMHKMYKENKENKVLKKKKKPLNVSVKPNVSYFIDVSDEEQSDDSDQEVHSERDDDSEHSLDSEPEIENETEIEDNGSEFNEENYDEYPDENDDDCCDYNDE